jgi:hypothetical protein
MNEQQQQRFLLSCVIVILEISKIDFWWFSNLPKNSSSSNGETNGHALHAMQVVVVNWSHMNAQAPNQRLRGSDVLSKERSDVLQNNACLAQFMVVIVTHQCRR